MPLPLTLLFDPLCGWCYGAHPALAAVDAALAPAWTLLPTGLFAQPQSMTAQKAAYFWQNDQRIAELTGQVFSPAYREQVLADLATPFDSTLATQAWLHIVAAQPSAGLQALHRIQALRYMDGEAYTPASLSRVAATLGLDALAFQQALQGGWPAQAEALLGQARQLMHRHGLNGVPSLLCQGRPVPSQLLYQPAQLVDYLQQQH